MRNSSAWDVIVTTVALQVERFGNWIGMNYKLDHISRWDTFSFHSSAFRFMSNVILKWYIFNMHTLYFVIPKLYLKPAVYCIVRRSKLFRKKTVGRKIHLRTCFNTTFASIGKPSVRSIALVT
jgi:hypothetical protein